MSLNDGLRKKCSEPKFKQEDTMTEEIKKVCKCEKCGNESEMIITCSLPSSQEEASDSKGSAAADEQPKRVKGIATCTNCGNEADMWIDL
jgi:hypothetical protein